MAIGSGSITIVDMIDSATYIYYAKDINGTDASITPSNDKKYIGFYNGPAISGGPPDKPENLPEGTVIEWQKYSGEDGKNGENGITPIQLVISSQNGTVFVNGIPELTLQAKVYHDGVDITDNYTDETVFQWFKVEKLGQTIGSGTKTPIGTGKKIIVSSSDITDHENFICSITVPNEDERLQQLPLWDGGTF